MLTIQSTAYPELLRNLKTLVRLLEVGYYPGEETQIGQHIVVQLVRDLGVKPFDVKFEFKAEDSMGCKIKRADFK